ncbi:MAG TPA: thioredoxin domain-containing protein [Anaerolineales bacterium]|nr:thioredoxin domain-containing protein [Anaerolineales bacterium]
MHHKPIDVTDELFNTSVLETQKPVVVDFWAEWCPSCKDVSLWMQNLAETRGDRLVVAKVEADNNPDTIAACGVRGLPAILFFREGQLVHRQVDRIDEAGLARLVDTLLLQE